MTSHYILSISCVNGWDLQLRAFSLSDLVDGLHWLDHEGAQWDAVVHEMDDAADRVVLTTDITDVVRAEYCGDCQ